MADSNANIAILMATYNGETFLREQIDSLFAQTCQDWHLYVHDDGSSDGTVAILQEYKETYPSRITIMDYPSQGGACKNFLSMLERVEAPYYMFCDQDDVWFKNKIDRSLKELKSVEGSEDMPIVVHSDLRIVDDDKKVIHESFFDFANIHPERISKYEQYTQDIVTGCTMLFNHKAKEAALAHSYERATMHDSWITLRVVAEGGLRQTIYEQLTDYRQHRDNVLGAQDGHRFTLTYRLGHIREMLRDNIAHYAMLKDAGKISMLSYLINKYKSFKTNNK